MEFEGFAKIPRLTKGFHLSEKIDGTNAQIYIGQINAEGFIGTPVDMDYDRGLFMFAGSRKRYITPEDDNFGFARWCLDNAEELYKLGPGRHFGEWFGPGIQKNPLNVSEKRLAMFNPKWIDQGPECIEVVPQLGLVTHDQIDEALRNLYDSGTQVKGGEGEAEGIMLYHEASQQIYKRTFHNDEGKWNE